VSDAPPPGGYPQQPQQPGGYQPPQPPTPPSYQPPTYQPPPTTPGQPMYQQPAQFQPVNPGASSSGNGCLKAFLIISAISVVLGIVIVVAAVFLVGNAVDEIAGTADPSDYEIVIDDCTVSEFGIAEATGTITNKDSGDHGFTIDVEFNAEGSTARAGSSSTFIDSLNSGQSEAWTITSSVTGDPTAIECKVSSVEYFF
jgi:hypothetical protein